MSFRNQHARIRNGRHDDILLEHVSQGSTEHVTLVNEQPTQGSGEVIISPEAIPDLIIQLQGLLDFLSPIQNRKLPFGGPIRIGGK